jgi:hypothetical protein
METKPFQLRVGDFCANGAEVLAVMMDEIEGVVLATWKQEFITWVFPTNNQRGTAHGNYFMFNLDKEGDEREAYKRAREDFLERVTQIHRGATK